MKKITMMFVLSLSTMFAGAGTIDWNAWSAGAAWTDLGISGNKKEFRIETGGNNAHPICKYNGNADFALQVIFAGGMELTGAWGDLLTVRSSGDVYRIQKTGNRNLAGYRDRGGSDWTSLESPAGSLPTTDPLTILFTYDHSENRIALVVDGQEVGYGSATIPAWITLETGRGERSIFGKAFSNYDLESVKFSTSEVIPEPTVASLLALAVAGLALRRKRG